MKNVVTSMFLILSLFLSLALSSQAADPAVEDAKPTSALIFILKDITTQDLIASTYVNIEYVDTATRMRINTLEYVGDEGILTLTLPQSSYDLTLRIDMLETEGKDYYFQRMIEVRETFNDTLYLLPSGSVSGIVLDKEGNLIPKAQIKCECAKDYGEHAAVVTDSYGSFSKQWLPAGSCTFYATKENSLGTKTVSIARGSMQSIEIILDKNLKATSYIMIGLALLFLLAFGLVLFLVHKRKFLASSGSVSAASPPAAVQETKITAIEHQKEREDALAYPSATTRAEDILKTLSGNEKKIVEYLLTSTQTGINAVPQAALMHNLRMPKTTLARLLDGLEHKNIVQIERLGKLKKVQLTDWMLEK